MLWLKHTTKIYYGERIQEFLICQLLTDDMTDYQHARVNREQQSNKSHSCVWTLGNDSLTETGAARRYSQQQSYRECLSSSSVFHSLICRKGWAKSGFDAYFHASFLKALADTEETPLVLFLPIWWILWYFGLSLKLLFLHLVCRLFFCKLM